MKFLGVAGRAAFAAFLVALVVGLTAAFGTRLGFWNYHTGLDRIFPFSLAFGALAFVIGLGWIVTALAANKATGLRYGLVGFFGSLVILGIPLVDYSESYGLPPIHDISTDVEHPPEFVALLDRRDGATNPPDYDGPRRVVMNGKTYTTKQLQKRYYGEIHTLGRLGISPEQFFNKAVQAARDMGWAIVAVVPDEGRLEATDTSFFFGLVSDIVVRVKPSGIGARLDIRAKSRVGQADGGANAKLIKAYLKRLQTA